MSTTDVRLMRRALRLAARGRGQTAPNPPVGAVIVSPGGEVIGEGWHTGSGTDHAEVVALAHAGERARGATMYVTLEPCTHEGRTPPCAPRLIEAGLARVVVGIVDPNPIVHGSGIGILRGAGLAVEVGVEEREAAELIAGFAYLVTSGRPLVTLKLASSLDGRVAAADGSSRWITGPSARRDVHRLRSWSDAVIVGSGTVLADDPELTCRLRGYGGHQPLRVVLDSSASTPLAAKVLSDAAPTLIATTHKAPEDAVAALRARGAEVVRFPARDGRIDLATVVEELGRRRLCDVLVEGGPTVAGDLVEHGLVDRYVFYIAPKLLGQVGVGALSGVVVPNIADARELTIDRVRRIGADIKVEGRPRI